MGETVLVPAVRSLRASWEDAEPYQRVTYVVGSLLVAVGVAHLLVWAAVGGPWTGPIGWRKPVTFGVSFGMTTLTLGWMATYLPMARRTGWLLFVPLAVANTIEVAWVSLQRARGVASHFNTDTPLDNALFLANGLAILVTVAVILTLTWRAFTAASGPASMRFGIRAGLVVLLVSMAVGGVMIGNGLTRAAAGGTALTTFGEAGIMKVPHAVGMHAIQLLPGLAWLLSFTSIPEPARLRLVEVAAAGYGLLVAVSLLQTFTGVAPWDLGIVSGVLLLGSLAAFAAGAAGTLRAFRRRRALA